MIQIASLMFWLPLEIYQMETFGHPTFVIALRFKNIVAFALGKMDAWGLNTEAMKQDPGITCTSRLGIFCRFCCGESGPLRVGWWIWLSSSGSRPLDHRWRLMRLRTSFKRPGKRGWRQDFVVEW